MLAHLLTFVGYLVVVGSVVPPLVILLAKKDQSEFVADQAKEALNFQITVLLALIAGSVLVFTFVFACVGYPFLVLVGIGNLVLVIMAAIRAHAGERYRYPWALRFVT